MQDQNGAAPDKALSRRNLKKYIDFGLPLVGTQIIVTVMLFTQALPTVAYIVVAVILVEVGIWKLAPRLLPNNRKYNALRAETNRFLYLVRNLNTAALNVKADDTPENRESVEMIHAKMQKLLDRIVSVAGQTDYELALKASGENPYDDTDMVSPQDMSNQSGVHVNS